jgi:hypothetical protein
MDTLNKAHALVQFVALLILKFNPKSLPNLVLN